MRAGRSLNMFGYSVLSALVLVGAVPRLALAQTDHDHTHTIQQHSPTLEEKARESALIAAIRAATDRFSNPMQAESEGYGLLFGCVSDPSRRVDKLGTAKYAELRR